MARKRPLGLSWLRSGRKRNRSRRPGRRAATATLLGRRPLLFESLEPRLPLASDFGDAPDTGAGTGLGDYETLAANGGPSHTIVAGLFLGNSVDGDDGTLQNARANADDVDGSDDEEGVLSPATDLLGTIGAAPTITLLATNLTGSVATLSGWIDTNNDGVFDNATERTQIAVADGTTDGRFTLTFPTVPTGFTGETYTRFRLSTDAASDNPIGAASDGEVEDYTFVITLPAEIPVNVKSQVKISDGLGGLAAGSLDGGDLFGSAVASLGDLDGDGVADMAVGARNDAGTDLYEGAVYVLLMNADGTVRSQVKIGDGTAGGLTPGSLDEFDLFGSSVAGLGDLDGDGVPDVAVGAYRDENSETYEGAVYVLLMNSDGTVKSQVKISDGTPGGLTPGSLDGSDSFGASIASLGDLDGDGVGDMAVGAHHDEGGAVYVLLMNSDGTVKSQLKISDGTSGGLTPGSLDSDDRFASSIASLGDLDGDGVPELAVGARFDENTDSKEGAVYVLSLAPPIPFDFGDAPDTGAGTGTDDYETLAANGGPSHMIVAGLFLGNSVDDDDGMLQNARANADDVDWALPDDEDGLIDPPADLSLTEGTTPAVRVNVTNTTISPATLYGWIDYNTDGLFDNATERASVSVPVGTDGETLILSFPTVPNGTDGTTYARFRLSTDGAASDPTGAADDGEVEDYVATITAPSNGKVSSEQEIGEGIGGFGGELSAHAYFGWSSAGIGDLDGDGIEDIAVGAPRGGDSPGYGDVWVLFMNADGTVKTEQRISAEENGFDAGWFGISVTSLGDLNGDGVIDLAVGVDQHSNSPARTGSVQILFMNSDGTVASSQKIDGTSGGFGGVLEDSDRFGQSVAGIGDLDGDGVPDLVVGASYESRIGAVWVLFLNPDGTVKSEQKIGSTDGGLSAPLDHRAMFGWSVASLGDLNGDGINDIAVGASRDDGGFSGQGAVYVLFLNRDGTVKSEQKISATSGGFEGPLDDFVRFGQSVSSLGDLDGDGVEDLAVGVYTDNDGGPSRGAVWLLFLNTDGTVKAEQKISNTEGGFAGALEDFNRLGVSVANIGDLNDDGVIDLVIGATADVGSNPEGEVWIVNLAPLPQWGAGPHAEPDVPATDEDVAVDVAILTNDTPFGQVEIVDFTQPSPSGVVSDLGGGTLRFTPELGFTGDATFDYTITSAQAKRNASDVESNDRYGDAVAADGTLAVVGARLEDSQIGNAGAAYVLEQQGDTWVELAKLTADDALAKDQFGRTVAISGTTIAIGAPNADDNGRNSGKVYIFERNIGNPSQWDQTKILLPADGAVGDKFGLAIDLDGDTLVVSSTFDDDAGTNSGSIYVFGRDVGGVGGWGQVAKQTASDATAFDEFGRSVGIDGNRIVVGAFRNDDAGGNSGSAYIFERNEGGANLWGEVKKLTASDAAAGDHFGYAVDVSGTTVVVGARLDDDVRANSGSVYVYDENEGGLRNWGEVTKRGSADPDTGANFGAVVGISGDRIVVGSPRDDVGTRDNAGSAAVLERDLGGIDNWGELEELEADDPGANDWLGESVAISGPNVFVGAPRENPSAIQNAGSLYIQDVRRDTTTVTVTVSAPLLAVGGEARSELGTSPQTLGATQLQPIVDVAIASWAATGLDADQVARLRGVDFQITDLSGARLGETSGDTIRIDVDAAGYGWFVDATPYDATEFANERSVNPQPDSMDLLTVVLHELGHVIDDPHAFEDEDLMLPWLETGVRRTPTADDVDLVFAQQGEENLFD